MKFFECIYIYTLNLERKIIKKKVVIDRVFCQEVLDDDGPWDHDLKS